MHHSHLNPQNEKSFIFNVKAASSKEAIAALKHAVKELESGGDVIRESGCEIIPGVHASYYYPNRPHCAMMGSYWDE